MLIRAWSGPLGARSGGLYVFFGGNSSFLPFGTASWVLLLSEFCKREVEFCLLPYIWSDRKVAGDGSWVLITSFRSGNSLGAISLGGISLMADFFSGFLSFSKLYRSSVFVNNNLQQPLENYIHDIVIPHSHYLTLDLIYFQPNFSIIVQLMTQLASETNYCKASGLAPY